jgi:hypothetical protein
MILFFAAFDPLAVFAIVHAGSSRTAMPDPETYDLAPDARNKASGVRAPNPPSPAQPPTHVHVPYLTGPTQRQADRFDLMEGEPARNLWIPIALTLVGCAAIIGRMLYFNMFRSNPLEHASYWAGFMLAWNLAVLLIGAVIIAKLTGISFGPLPTATIKLAAIAVAPHAVTMLIEMALGGDWIGITLGWLAGIPFALWLFVYLFELDFSEAFICVGITTVLRWASYLLYWLS